MNYFQIIIILPGNFGSPNFKKHIRVFNGWTIKGNPRFIGNHNRAYKFRSFEAVERELKEIQKDQPHAMAIHSNFWI